MSVVKVNNITPLPFSVLRVAKKTSLDNALSIPGVKIMIVESMIDDIDKINKYVDA